MTNLFFIETRKVPVKVDDDEGHPPGENEEEKSDSEPAESVCTFIDAVRC